MQKIAEATSNSCKHVHRVHGWHIQDLNHPATYQLSAICIFCGTEGTRSQPKSINSVTVYPLIRSISCCRFPYHLQLSNTAGKSWESLLPVG
eukprot:8355-Amphidinium_carterae.2